MIKITSVAFQNVVEILTSFPRLSIHITSLAPKCFNKSVLSLTLSWEGKCFTNNLEDAPSAILKCYSLTAEHHFAGSERRLLNGIVVTLKTEENPNTLSKSSDLQGCPFKRLTI